MLTSSTTLTEAAPDLHTDAVQRVVPYKSSVVYYLENGVEKLIRTAATDYAGAVRDN